MNCAINLNDIGKQTWSDTTSSDSLRNISIAGVTAGVASYASDAMKVEQMANAANAANTANEVNSTQQAIQNP